MNFPRYLCVVERCAYCMITLLTILIGVPDLEAKVAACLRHPTEPK